ncbi:uncharacterized protein LOC122382009 [Amphibalanus amphitrite]|uniref:uncharacterized protein LOC122382009 n=1 Tax=Amphibalanus amphitrite TaxID=1232801 RepID=UPI001C918843|nr:uncharacterized protein LOC122382009 [Amphibalanus amphitrite]
MHYANFVSIVDRLDCTDTYSVIYTCSQCKEAYHDWLCAMYVPFCGSEGRRLRPCRSHCQRVQRVCPFFLPSERKSAATQYAGEPAFFCDDPDIPDIPPFTTGSTYGDPDCCYHSCCVRPDQPECSADTCSAAAACPGQAGPPPPPPPAAPASAGAWAVRFNQLQRHSPAAKEAYHDWLCAMYVPFCGSEGRRLRPCRSHCQRVQRVCPFFLPSERKSAATQYAGEPAFFCDDPDIPDIPPFTTGSTYGDPDCCYHSCCVRPDQPECSADTCSAAAACPGQAGPPPPPPPAAPASAGAWAVRFNQLQRHSPAAKGPAWLGLGPVWLSPGPVFLGQGPVSLGQGPA